MKKTHKKGYFKRSNPKKVSRYQPVRNNTNSQGKTPVFPSIISLVSDYKNRLLLYLLIALVGFFILYLNNRQTTEQLKLAYENPAKKIEIKKDTKRNIEKHKNANVKITKFDKEGKVTSIIEKAEITTSSSHSEITQQQKEEIKPILPQSLLNSISLLGSYNFSDQEYALGIGYKLPLLSNLSTGISLSYPSFKPSLFVLIQF